MIRDRVVKSVYCPVATRSKSTVQFISNVFPGLDFVSEPEAGSWVGGFKYPTPLELESSQVEQNISCAPQSQLQEFRLEHHHRQKENKSCSNVSNQIYKSEIEVCIQ